MLRRTLITALLAGTALSLIPATNTPWITSASAEAAAAIADNSASLPIKSITLYRSGVGAFAREGTIVGDQQVQLRFETEQINDILKSMVLSDLDGGHIGAVSYGSKEPLERRLAAFGVNIANAQSMDALFQQLRGASLRVTTAEGEFVGPILGVEARITVIPPTPGGQPGHYQEWYVNIVTPQGVRSIATSTIRTFALADPALNDELNRALAAVAEHRVDRLKTVDLTLTGAPGKERRVLVGYVHEMPVWKTSYRLVFPEKQGEKPIMQGWAIVENTTDEDWHDVRLSLASGRPVGFTMDLYEPIFVKRPELPVPVGGALAAREYEDASFARAPGAAPAPAFDAREMAKAAVAQNRRFTGDGERVLGTQGGLDKNEMLSDTAAIDQRQATGADVGEQFMYTLDTPVTVERQRSAMLPIIGAPITARRVSIYTGWANDKHPMRGAELNNDSGLSLLPGPIAVYDTGVYAGDSSIPHTSRGQKRLLTYALDIDVRGRRDVESTQDVTRIRIVDGTIRRTSLARQKTTYHFDNNDASRERTLIIEHEKMPGWEIKQPAKPSEETDNALRFETTLKPSAHTTLDVSFERVFEDSVTLTSFDLSSLLHYRQQGKASQAVVDAVKKAGELNALINTTNTQLTQLETERKALAQDQSRVRENMSSVEHNSELYARFVKKFGAQETRLEDIDTQITKLRAQLSDQQEALADYLRHLDIE